MNYGQNSDLQRSLSAKITGAVGGMLLLEAGAFVGVCMWIGFWNACWLTFGITLLGYAIKPRSGAQAPVRSVVSWLLMIPGFVLDVLAIVVAIKPLREGIRNRILSKVLPPEMTRSFTGENAARFSDFMRGMGEMGQGCNRGAGCQAGGRCRAADDVIDIAEGADGYEVKYSGRHDVVMKKASPEASKSLVAEDVIDVEHEWR